MKDEQRKQPRRADSNGDDCEPGRPPGYDDFDSGLDDFFDADSPERANMGNQGNWVPKRGVRNPASAARGFRGQGPRDYHRSDERIYDDVCDALTIDPDIDASQITVRVEDQVVSLTGEVESRSAQLLAESLAQECAGVMDVDNQLRVDNDAMQKRRRSLGASIGWNGHLVAQHDA